MRTTTFSETEIIYAVKQVEAGISIKEIARKYGVCENTVYRWRRKYDELYPLSAQLICCCVVMQASWQDGPLLKSLFESDVSRD